MAFHHTTAIKRIRRMTARKKVIQGGTSAGKTYAILAVLIHIAAKAKTEISVVSESIPHLRRGAMKDFGKVMQWTNRWRDEGWNKTLLTYTFANGSTIEFFSADQEAKLRGARRQVLYINEANNIEFEAYHQLAIRTSEAIYIDFNPVSEFWAHTEVLAEQDSELIVLTYRDNEALPATIRDDIESAQVKAATSTYWANWWKVYGLGEVGSLQGVVFDDWQQVDGIDFAGDKLVAIGLDWGYTNDPTAVVAVYKRGSAILMHELIYQNGLTNQDIAEHLRKLGINRSWPIIADSAEPKSIEEVHRLGFNIHPATKGADSIRNSIDILKRQPLLVTRESTNLIKELRNYTWDTDRTGASLGVPIDRYNHAIDAVRYVALNKLSANAGGRYVIM
jgi:phage terminase large subunit